MPQHDQDLGKLSVSYPGGKCLLTDLLQYGHTDALVVIKSGTIVYEWHADHFDSGKQHILFSISKSVTALVAGILESRGLIDSNGYVIDYLPGVKGSVYENCSVRNILDMTVSLDFEENYTDRESEYMKYRVATAWNPVDQNQPGPALEEFLYTLKPSAAPHGESFLYRSPNSDLLGLILERAAGMPLAEIFSRCLWKPLGAADDAYITVDRCGLARAAGGICMKLHDLARVGQLILDSGEAEGKQVLPEQWIRDTFTCGDRQAWKRGNYAHRIPNGRYRNQWYQLGDEDGCISGRGIHGQLIYINPARSTVIVRLSSMPDPLNDAVTNACLDAFLSIARELG